jgi:AcrR family transcriptional regulator
MELNPTSVSAKSLRERHKDATRAELRSSALDLFENRGFAGTSVDDIARAAGVSRSTFFRYFPSKEAVLFGDMDGNADVFITLLRDRPSSEGRMEALEATLMEFSQAMRSDERRAEMLPVERIIESDQTLSAKRAAVTERWRQDVAEALAQRGARRSPDVEDELAAAILSQIVERLGVEWRSSPDTPVGELIRQFFASLRRLIETRTS